MAYGDYLYWINTKQLRYSDSRAACAQWGGKLASVTSTAETQELVNFVKRAGVRKDLYFGLRADYPGRSCPECSEERKFVASLRHTRSKPLLFFAILH